MSHSNHILSIQIDTSYYIRLLDTVWLLDARKYAKKVGKQAEKGTEAKYQICIILHLNINLL